MAPVSTVAAHRETAASRSSPPQLKFGSRGLAVRTLQTLLNQKGLKLAVDGIFGPKTRAAVRRYQLRSGVPANGVVDARTWAKLRANTQGVTKAKPATKKKVAGAGKGPLLKLGARGGPVRTLQRRLNSLGYKAGGVDGVYGNDTKAAVKRYQRKHGLPADGIVGATTWAELGIVAKGKVSYGPTVSAGIRLGGYGKAYVQGRPHTIRLAYVNGVPMSVATAKAFVKMRAAATRAGIPLKLNSGFRTYEKQAQLYRTMPPGYAARPGYSNHQNGIALDIQVGAKSSSIYRWLANNARRFGFKRTVFSPDEPWHWEYRP